MVGEWGFRRRALLVVGGSAGGSALLAVLLLVLPKFVDVSTFGYVQLYLFYVTYLSYVTLGISDGLFIRFSGIPLHEIPSEVVSGHFRVLAAALACLVPCAVALIGTLVRGPQAVVLSVALLSTSIYLLRSLLTFVYQAAGDAQPFARSTLMERALWVLTATLLLAAGYRQLELFLWTDFLARLCGLLWCIRTAWPLLKTRASDWREAVREVQQSLRVGLFVSVAAIATVLVPAVGRFAAERGFGIEVFAELSLAFSLQSIVLSVIGPIGLVVLPSLKRQKQAMPSVYERSASSVGVLLLSSVTLYFPLALAMNYWLPEFTLLPTLLALIFPMIVFESRTRILAIPFMQALHLERALMGVNVASLAVGCAMSFAAVRVLDDVTALALSLLLVVALRGLTLEKLVEQQLSVSRWVPTALELLAIGAFVAIALQPGTPVAWLLGAAAWSAYLYNQRASILAVAARAHR